MQKWPYYSYVSANWDEYALHGTEKVNRSNNPTKLVQGEKLDMNSEFKDGQTWIESLQSTQVKGFVVMKDNQILAEYFLAPGQGQRALVVRLTRIKIAAQCWWPDSA